MYTELPKKLLVVAVLEVLRKYSDANHRLSQKEISDLVRREYGIEADRKSIKRNLQNLVDFGFELKWDETPRTGRSGELESIQSSWYLVHDFDQAELRLVIDGVLSSRSMSQTQCKELIDKLSGLSSKYFDAHVKSVKNLPEKTPRNAQLFYTIGILDDAIAELKKVEFTYNEIGLDKKLHPRLNNDGTARRYLINPYQMVVSNGRYYLIGNYESYDDVSHYRVDFITDIKLLDARAKPKNDVPGIKAALNLPAHKAEHVYMYSGPSVEVTFRADIDSVSEIVDWFGTDVVFSDTTSESTVVKVKVNQRAMLYWLLQYGRHVEVLAPEDLRQQVIESIKQISKRYGLSE